MARRNPTPGSQTSLREANRARIVESLRHHGRLTQVELAGTTGLSPATVSNIVKELSGSGVLHTSVTSRSGRRATLVTLSHEIGLVAGVHFSSRHLRIAIADASTAVVAETHVPLSLDHRHDAELDRVVLLLGDMCDSLGTEIPDLLAVGLGIPAPVDRRTGMVSTPGLLRGWEGIDVGGSLEARVGLPVFVDSEANLGGLAEVRSGAAREAPAAAFIHVGHHISAALMIDGTPFHGVTGKAGQIGHVTIDENGPICRCGNRGCLETLAAGPALLDLFREDAGMHRVTDLVHAAEDGDASSQRVIADAGRHIGIAAANLSNLFDPERIVVGGELGLAGETLLAPLRHALERSALASADGIPEVVTASWADRAALQGAIALALENAPMPIEIADKTPA